MSNQSGLHLKEFFLQDELIKGILFLNADSQFYVCY